MNRACSGEIGCSVADMRPRHVARLSERHDEPEIGLPVIPVEYELPARTLPVEERVPLVRRADAQWRRCRVSAVTHHPPQLQVGPAVHTTVHRVDATLMTGIVIVITPLIGSYLHRCSPTEPNTPLSLIHI